MKLISKNPATEKVEYVQVAHTHTQLLKKVQAAHAAYHVWRAVPIAQRTALLGKLARSIRERKQSLGEIMTREMGKPLARALTELEKCAKTCEYYRDSAEKFLADKIISTDSKKSYVHYQPLGPILAIMPWNFPYWQVFRCAAPALAAGNTVLLKHASNVSRCAVELERLFRQAGFLPGVFTTLLAPSKEITKLIQNSHIAALSLTGSVEAGKSVAVSAGASLKKVVLELGGSDPFIVLEDADMLLTVSAAIDSRFNNCGQSCVAAKRFIVLEKIASQFEQAILKKTQELVVGNPLDPSTQIGPLARADLRLTLDKQVKKAIKQGAQLLVGGYTLPGKGYFYAPTVLTNLTPRFSIASEEVFGPVVCIYKVADEKAAIALANNTQFGLGASIWSRDLKKAEALALQVESGLVFVNTVVRSDPQLPFGGIKNSGFGRELGEEGIKEFVNVKTVVINYSGRPKSFP